MSTIIRSIAVVLGLLVSAGSTWAAPADHLQCFRIKDAATKAFYHADLAPTEPTFPLATGCIVKVPAKLLCVDVVKSNVTPLPPGSPVGPATQPYLCYQTKCPKAQPTTNVTDQFGVHAVQVKTTGLLCAPVDVTIATTTTTTITTTTTTVPFPTCTDTIKNGTESDVDCGGTCPRCLPGKGCAIHGDCTSNICQGGICASPTCSDTTKNGDETDVDCGGSCLKCAPGKHCLLGSDCVSGTCSFGLCQ